MSAGFTEATYDSALALLEAKLGLGWDVSGALNQSPWRDDCAWLKKRESSTIGLRGHHSEVIMSDEDITHSRVLNASADTTAGVLPFAAVGAHAQLRRDVGRSSESRISHLRLNAWHISRVLRFSGTPSEEDLKHDALPLLMRDRHRFSTTYGWGYVHGLYKGWVLSVTFDMKKISSKDQSKLLNSVGLSAAAPESAVKIEAKYNTCVGKFLNKKDVCFEVHQIGCNVTSPFISDLLKGDGLSTLPDVRCGRDEVVQVQLEWMPFLEKYAQRVQLQYVEALNFAVKHRIQVRNLKSRLGAEMTELRHMTRDDTSADMQNLVVDMRGLVAEANKLLVEQEEKVSAGTALDEAVLEIAERHADLVAKALGCLREGDLWNMKMGPLFLDHQEARTTEVLLSKELVDTDQNIIRLRYGLNGPCKERTKFIVEQFVSLVFTCSRAGHVYVYACDHGCFPSDKYVRYGHASFTCVDREGCKLRIEKSRSSRQKILENLQKEISNHKDRQETLKEKAATAAHRNAHQTKSRWLRLVAFMKG